MSTYYSAKSNRTLSSLWFHYFTEGIDQWTVKQPFKFSFVLSVKRFLFVEQSKVLPWMKYRPPIFISILRDYASCYNGNQEVIIWVLYDIGYYYYVNDELESSEEPKVSYNFYVVPMCFVFYGFLMEHWPLNCKISKRRAIKICTQHVRTFRFSPQDKYVNVPVYLFCIVYKKT